MTEPEVTVLKLSELRGIADDHGIGSLLMTDGPLRQPSGAPYQAATYFDEQGVVVALVTDAEGQPLGHHGTEDPASVDDFTFARLPGPVADAAREWIARQLSG